MANLASSSLCLLIFVVLFFSSGGGSRINVKAAAAGLATASPPKEEPCYAWAGKCDGPASDKEKNDEMCKMRCYRLTRDGHGFCKKIPENSTNGFCLCPLKDCRIPAPPMMINS